MLDEAGVVLDEAGAVLPDEAGAALDEAGAVLLDEAGSVLDEAGANGAVLEAGAVLVCFARSIDMPSATLNSILQPLARVALNLSKSNKSCRAKSKWFFLKDRNCVPHSCSLANFRNVSHRRKHPSQYQGLSLAWKNATDLKTSHMMQERVRPSEGGKSDILHCKSESSWALPRCEAS